MRTRGRSWWATLALMTAILVMTSASAYATVWTDQSDYAPGSIVTISGDNSNGAGYLPGEAVHVDVSGPNGYATSCEGVADDSGAWSCQVALWDSPLAAGEYSYTAAGGESGVTETGSFTDNVLFSITAPAENSGDWYRTMSGGFDVTVGGKYTCNTSGAAANNCTSANAAITLHPTDNANNTVSATVLASKSVSLAGGATNADWSTVFEFRTSPGSGQFSIPADGKYEVKGVFSFTPGIQLSPGGRHQR
jgi:hypothetical protein